MSILNTFWVLFKGDNSDLQKKQKENVGFQREFETSIKDTQFATQGLRLSLMDMAVEAGAALTAIFSLGSGVKEVFSAEQELTTIGRFGKAIGVNRTLLYAWGQELKRVAGNSADIKPAVEQLVTQLNRSVGVAGTKIISLPINAFTGDLGRAGINLLDAEHRVRDFNDILLQEARVIDDHRRELKKKGLSDDDAEKVLFTFSKETLHNNEAISMLVLQGADRLSAGLKKSYENGVPTDEDFDRMDQFSTNWVDLKQKIDNFARSIGGPVVQFLNDLPDWLEKADIDFKGMATAIGIATAALIVLNAAAIIPLIASFMAFLVPFATFAAWALIIYAGLKLLGQYMPELREKFGSFFSSLKDWGMGALGLFKDLFSWAVKLGQAVAAFSSGGTLQERAKRFKEIMTDGENHASADNTADAVARAQVQLGIANGSALPAQTSNSITNRGGSAQTNSVSIGEVNVHTQATDSKGISTGISDELGKQFSQTIAQFDDGIYA